MIRPMVKRKQQRPMPPQARQATALLVLALFLWVGLLSVVPALHHAVCGEDAATSQHHCVVTLFSKGQLTAAYLQAPTLQPPVSFADTLPLHSKVWYSVDVRLKPSRDPPLLSS
jgi:hypothetical protein